MKKKIKDLTPLEALNEAKVLIHRLITSGDWEEIKEHLDFVETALEDLEWLKHKLNLIFLNSLSSPEDKMRVMKIMGVEYDETYTK